MTIFEKLRLRTKLPNIKKPRKKPLAKQGRNGLNRRSMSVPDLTLVPGEAFAAENSLTPKASDAISFSVSSGQSDTDSVASWSNTDGPLCTDKTNEPAPEVTFRTHQNPSATALKRLSAPVEVFSLYEEPKVTTNTSLESKMDSIPENLYAQVNKKRNVPLPLESGFLPRNASGTLAQSDFSERLSLSGEMERQLSDNVASALPRVSSQGKEMTPFLDKSTPLFEQMKFTFERLTPPAKRKNASAERLALQFPQGNTDGAFVDSPCTSPSEEKTISWAKEIEELMVESNNPLLLSEMSMEESVLEPDESLDEVSMVTNVASCLLFMTSYHARTYFFN